MKKTGTLLIGILLVLLCTAACGTKVEAGQAGESDGVSLKSGSYTLQNVERDVPGDFTITIYDDGTFQSYETPISSYMGMGHYSIKNDIITLTEDEGGCTGDINYYRITDGKLSFISKDSANYHFVPLKDGDSFVWTSDAQ